MINLDKIIEENTRLRNENTIRDFKICMVEAIRQALNLAADNAIAKDNPSDYGTGEIYVDRLSILDVINYVK